MTDKKTLVYLACPYSHPDAEVRVWRFEQANTTAARMMNNGIHVFSPISHTHPIVLAGDLPKGWEFWAAYDEAVLQYCARIVVLTLPGWEDSIGIANELKIARELDLPIDFQGPVEDTEGDER